MMHTENSVETNRERGEVVEHFGDRLSRLIRERNSRVVVGVDPRLDQMPPILLQSFGVPASDDVHRVADLFEAYGKEIVDAVEPAVVGIKVQVAFYEQYGWKGMQAFARTLGHIQERGLLAIADVKRGDIGSTAAAYAGAYLGNNSPFPCDAVTVNGYFGSDGLKPFVDAAIANGKGLFALVKTSNSSSGELQDLHVQRAQAPTERDANNPPGSTARVARHEGDEPALYERVAAIVRQWDEEMVGESGYSCAGAVVGATYPEELARLRRQMPHTPFLVPGYGAQGGGVRDVVGAFDSRGLGGVISASRSILGAWRHERFREHFGPERFAEAAAAAAAGMRDEINQAVRGAR